MSAALFGLVLLSRFLRVVYCQSVSTAVVSKSPVYSGDPITLTCTLESDDAAVISITLDAVNDTQNVGTLFCRTSKGAAFRNTGAGRFGGYRFTGCEDSSVNNQSISFNASPSWELDYRCTYEIYISSSRTTENVTSAFMHLSVSVRPAVPKLKPHPLTFTDRAVVQCESFDARPAAIIRLTIRSTKKMELVSTSSESTSLMLPPPLINWNNATATCSVLNHDFPDMTTTSTITIHRSALLTVSSNPVYSKDPVHLTCSYNTADTLFAATIDAFNRTQKKGSLRVSRNGAEVFVGSMLNEFSRSITSTNITLWATASPLLELDFNCTVTVILDDGSFFEMTSTTVSLMVHVLPDVPRFLPSSLVIQRTGSATVACESRNGYPAAVINFTIATLNGSLLTAMGTECVLLNLTVPLDWHNAKASCTVTNHIFLNLSAIGTVVIDLNGSFWCEKCWIVGPVVGGITFSVIVIVILLRKRGHFSFRRKRKFSGLAGSQKQPIVANPQDSCVRDVMLLREDESSSSDRKLASAEMPYATLFAETACDKVAYESLLL